MTYATLRKVEAAQRDLKAKFEAGRQPIGWLLPYRKELRSIYDRFSASHNEWQVYVLRRYIRRCPADMKPICVWLLGNCVDRFRLYGIDELWNDPSPVVRRQVAKALRRAEAWSLLEEMVEAFPDDDRICWFATALTTHGSFAARLTNFVQSVDDSHASEVSTPSRMPYWANDVNWAYRPPKSRDFIRRMLRRIRHWVRWGEVRSKM